jgi:hypothetical protein
LIGTEATVSGGNSMAPAYMIDPTVNPTVVTRPSDVTGLVNTGSLVGLLDQADAVNVLESVERISAAKLGQVSTGLASAQDTAIKNLVQCSYVDAAYLVDKYGNAQAALDPTQDPNITGSGGIFSATDLQNSDFLATASVMKMVINGYAGAGTIEMGGFDYHDSTRATGETRDFAAGQCMGACLEYAARVGVPLMIYVLQRRLTGLQRHAGQLSRRPRQGRLDGRQHRDRRLAHAGIRSEGQADGDHESDRQLQQPTAPSMRPAASRRMP